MKGKKPLVSVVVPVYNSESTLKNCLKSIVSQKYPNYEVVIVNNNSTDSTLNIIEKFENKYSFVKSVFEKKQGRGSARNAGILASSGKMILMTDSDCAVPKNWIKDMIAPILEEGEKIVMGFQKDGIKNYWTTYGQKFDLKFANENGGKYIPHLDTKNFAADAKLMKKYLFDSSLKASEDLDFYLRISPKHKIRFLKNVKVSHFHNFYLSEVLRVFFERGFYSMKVVRARRKDNKTKDELRKNYISKNFNYPMLFLRFLYRLITQPITCWYLFVIGTAWQVGALFGRFNK